MNYGHTFGQSIETYFGLHQDKLKHGEAVALGITSAAKLSYLLFKNYDSESLWEKTNKILNAYNLPNKFNKLNLDDIPKISQLTKNILNDKKRISQGNRFILCKSIGNASIEIINNDDLIKASYDSLY